MNVAMKSKLPWLWYRLAVVVIILDQLTKLAINLSLSYGVPVEILPWS